MTFTEKFQFVMQLTNTSNQNLADAIGMPPSTISLYRSGKRGIPRKDDNLQKIVGYLAQKFETNYQIDALYEEIGLTRIVSGSDYSAIRSVLYNWFKGTEDTTASKRVHSILGAISASPSIVNISSHNAPLTTDGKFEANHTDMFFQREGMINAIHTLYRHLLSLPEPSVLYQLIDDDASWIFHNPILSNEIAQYTAQLEERGWKTLYFLPPASTPAYYELLSMCIRRFQSGLSTPFFYPRMRDNIYRSFRFYVPDEITLIMQDMADMSDHQISILSSDSRVLQNSETAFSQLSKEFLPAIDEINLSVFRNILEDHLAVMPGTHLHKTPSLSIETMPIELIEKIDSDQNNAFRSLHDLIVRRSRIRLSYSPYYDICGLPTAAQIKAREVPVCYVHQTSGATTFYTPELFIIHLENILHYLDSQPNYHFIPIPYDESIGCSIALNSSSFGLMLRFEDAKAYVIQDTGLRSVFYEHLLEYVDKIKHPDIEREHTKEKIRRLIKELRSH